MPDFTKLWDYEYIFGPNPIDMTRSDWVFLYAATAGVVIAIIIKIFVWRTEQGNPRRFFLNRLFHLFFTIGLLALLWAGFRYENIPWLSTHFVVLAIILIGLIWAAYIAKFAIIEFPGQRRVWEDQKIKMKYLASR